MCACRGWNYLDFCLFDKSLRQYLGCTTFSGIRTDLVVYTHTRLSLAPYSIWGVHITRKIYMSSSYTKCIYLDRYIFCFHIFEVYSSIYFMCGIPWAPRDTSLATAHDAMSGHTKVRCIDRYIRIYIL